MEEQKIKRFMWKDDDTWKLIQVWRSNIMNLRRSKRNKVVYDRMSKELKSMGLNIGVEEIRNKIKNLTKKYREEIVLQNSPTGSYPSDWKFYHSIRRILGQARLNDLNQIYGNIPHHNSLTNTPPSSWLTIVSEPDIHEIIKTEPTVVKTEPIDEDDDDEIETNEPTIQETNRNNYCATQYPPYPPIPMTNGVRDTSPASLCDPLIEEVEENETDNSSMSTLVENKASRQKKKLKRKRVIQEELLAEIKRSNQLAEKNEQQALKYAAEANKLLEKSIHVQERLLHLLSSRL